jgi:hypothetical protein
MSFWRRTALEHHIYTQQQAVAEHVFGYSNRILGTKRLSLRGNKKVNAD